MIARGRHDPCVVPRGYCINLEPIVLMLSFTTKDFWFWILLGFVCSCANGGSNGGFSSCGSADGAVRTVPFVPDKSRAAGTSSDSFSCRARAAAKCCCFVSKTWEDKCDREGFAFVVWLFWIKRLVFCALDNFKRTLLFFFGGKMMIYFCIPAFHSVTSIEILFYFKCMYIYQRGWVVINTLQNCLLYFLSSSLFGCWATTSNHNSFKATDLRICREQQDESRTLCAIIWEKLYRAYMKDSKHHRRTKHIKIKH